MVVIFCNDTLHKAGPRHAVEVNSLNTKIVLLQLRNLAAVLPGHMMVSECKFRAKTTVKMGRKITPDIIVVVVALLMFSPGPDTWQ